MDSIEVVRTQYTYEFINSCTIRVELQKTLFIPNNVDFHIHPFEDYLADLRVKFNGHTLPLLPHAALSEMVGVPVDIDVLRKVAADLLQIPVSQLEGYENFAVVKLPPHLDSYCEIAYTWIQSIQENRQRFDPLTKSIPIEVKFSPPGETSSLYVDVITNERLEIHKTPLVFTRNYNSYGIYEPYHLTEKKTLQENTEYEVILSDKKHYAIRFPRHVNYYIEISFTAVIPIMVRQWSWLGLILGIGIAFSIAIFAHSSNIQYFSAIGGGIIAGLIALRILLFHDIELLKWWNLAYITLIFVTAIMLIIKLIAL